MNSRERVLRALNLQRLGRVPIVPFIISFAAKYLGLKFIEYYRDGSKLARAQVSVSSVTQIHMH